jgi:hypothetical protein
MFNLGGDLVKKSGIFIRKYIRRALEHGFFFFKILFIYLFIYFNEVVDRIDNEENMMI